MYYPSFEFCRTDWMIETKITRLADPPDDDIYKGRSERTCLEVRVPPIQRGTILIPVGCGKSHVEYLISRTSLRRL